MAQASSLVAGKAFQASSLVESKALIRKLRSRDSAMPVPLLVVRLRDLEKTAWREGRSAARALERRSVRSFVEVASRTLRASDIVVHDSESSDFIAALVSPNREESAVATATDCRATLARLALAMESGSGMRLECGWSILHGPVNGEALAVGIESALERGLQERERYDFFAALGHELRTPLTSILGYLETLIEGDLDAKTRLRFLRVARAEAVRLARLVDGMFEVSLMDLGAESERGGTERRVAQLGTTGGAKPSAIERGASDRVDGVRGASEHVEGVRGASERVAGVRGVSERVDAVRGATERSGSCFLRATLAPALETLAPLAETHATAVTLLAAAHSDGDSGDVEVAMTSDRLTQVVTNLVENAIKHGRPAGSVWISASRLDPRYFELCVDDNGAGVPVAERESIFEFGRRGAAVRAKGSGIGLAIVRLMMERVGGEIDVVSSDRGGARFRVRIPLTPVEASPERAARPKPIAS